ncbi:protein MIZU-KUSSEI 1-like [Vicia villosa]|uniref:protein MIZU-KUSSEI 1-like n=1 Tax=Vicia villosa TaxID=3911 RepID=UPI00273BA634|nr:protein MIZU-KUSSEI 1-like [Vicia villosa]
MAYITKLDVGTTMTSVDCQKQVRSWRLLRSLIQLLIPTCNCTLVEQEQEQNYNNNSINRHKKYPSSSHSLIPSTTITGTIFGYRKGKVSFCIQSSPNSTNPILLLELAIPTSVLAKEMRGGTLRIVLESVTSGSCSNSNNLFSTPLWIMYCNGRKVGYAVKRKPSRSDIEALSLMRCVSVGTGVINGKEGCKEDDQLMFLRANFQRVSGSSKNECESFHLIDPEGSIGQELSIFFFQSR